MSKKTAFHPITKAEKSNLDNMSNEEYHAAIANRRKEIRQALVDANIELDLFTWNAMTCMAGRNAVYYVPLAALLGLIATWWEYGIEEQKMTGLKMLFEEKMSEHLLSSLPVDESKVN